MEIAELSDSPRGGKRPGAGRPKKTADQSADLYRTSRARKEAADADMAELKFKVESEKYVLRSAVQEASATALATLAQALRSMPDRLERKGLEAKYCRMVEEQIDATLDQAADVFELMAGTESATDATEGGPSDADCIEAGSASIRASILEKATEAVRQLDQSRKYLDDLPD